MRRDGGRGTTDRAAAPVIPGRRDFYYSLLNRERKAEIRAREVWDAMLEARGPVEHFRLRRLHTRWQDRYSHLHAARMGMPVFRMWNYAGPIELGCAEDKCDGHRPPLHGEGRAA